jgi:hypothetical protein
MRLAFAYMTVFLPTIGHIEYTLHNLIINHLLQESKGSPGGAADTMSVAHKDSLATLLK